MFVVVTKSSANCCTNQSCPIIADIDSGDYPEHGVIKRTTFVYRLANYTKSIAKAISSQKKKTGDHWCDLFVCNAVRIFVYQSIPAKIPASKYVCQISWRFKCISVIERTCRCLITLIQYNVTRVKYKKYLRVLKL